MSWLIGLAAFGAGFYFHDSLSKREKVIFTYLEAVDEKSQEMAIQSLESCNGMKTYAIIRVQGDYSKLKEWIEHRPYIYVLYTEEEHTIECAYLYLLCKLRTISNYTVIFLLNGTKLLLHNILEDYSLFDNIIIGKYNNPTERILTVSESHMSSSILSRYVREYSPGKESLLDYMITYGKVAKRETSIQL